MTKRKRYSPEFKRGAVEQARQPGVSCAQVSREFGRWVIRGFSPKSKPRRDSGGSLDRVEDRESNKTNQYRMIRDRANYRFNLRLALKLYRAWPL